VRVALGVLAALSAATAAPAMIAVSEFELVDASPSQEPSRIRVRRSPAMQCSPTMAIAICSQRARVAVIQSDNGREFAGRAMLTGVARNGVALRLIERQAEPECLC
jgi:hypothetical protein